MTRFVLRYHASDFHLPTGSTLVIGRDPVCDVCIDDPVASRRHARISVEPDRVWIEDLASRNGVHVNGTPIQGRHVLNPGDWFRIGRNEFSLRSTAAKAPTQARTTAVPVATMEIRLSDVWQLTPIVPSSPAAAAATDFDAAPMTKLEPQGGSPTLLILESGRKWLADRASSLRDRFTSAFEIVELLSRASAQDEAARLFHEALTLLEDREAEGVLPPSLAHRARERVRVLGAGRAGGEAWLQRLEVIDRAESGTVDDGDTSSHELGRQMARVALETDLRSAIASDLLETWYQPIIDLGTGRIVAFEALSRWLHPDRGMVPPVKFIPVAEESGLIIPLGQAVLKHSCAALRRFRLRSADVTMSVNLSGQQFGRKELVTDVERTVRETGLPPDAITMELTESSLMKDARAAARMLLQLRALGIRVSVDDFGTGYSSLAYLHQFPISSLKIDRTFVANLVTDRQSTEIVRTIITLAHSLNLAAVAEGVETEAQLQHLRAMRCDSAQGFLFAKAIPVDEADALLATDPRW